MTVHTSEQPVPEPGVHGVKISIEKLKRYKSSGIDKFRQK
jgi:hypothetical protein